MLQGKQWTRADQLRPAGLAAAIATALAGGTASRPASAQEDTSALEEVVVTGSRIVRRDLEAASPIATVDAEMFEESSTLAVESVLNQLPQFVPGQTQFNTSNVFPSATSTPGISTVDLRGLGAQRTLVLIDGRRAQPINSTLVIDVNSIPASAIESVEVISGGASAVYGADALGGVTNFRLRDNFEGVDLQARTSTTEHGGGQETNISLLLGSGLGDGRGDAMLAVEWAERDEVLAYDRPFMQKALKDSNTNAGTAARMPGFSYQPSATNRPSADAVRALYPDLPADMDITPLLGSAFLFNDDNTLYKVERGGLGFAGDVVNDPEYRIAPNGQLVRNNFDLRYSSPMERHSLFGKAHYALTDTLEAFSQVMFVNTTNLQVLQPTGAIGGFGATIPYGDGIYAPSLAEDGVTTLPEYREGGAYGLNCPATGGCTNSQAFPVPEQLRALLDSRGPDVLSTTEFDPNTGQPLVVQGRNSPWGIGGVFDFLPPRSMENTSNLYQVLAGFRGDLPLRDWSWEAYYSHGETRVDLDYIGWVSTARWQEIVSSPNYGRGLQLAGSGSTSLTCTSGLPVFERFEISPDCIEALAPSYTDRTRLTQDVIEATAQGGIGELPAGELRVAVGVSQRKNDFEYLPDATRETNSVVDIPVGTFGQANVVGSTEVNEIFGELLIPLLRDKRLARELELELGYRYSDYGDTGGEVPTYKALFSWRPIELVRFRGGYQLANRAPNINELFLEASSQAVTMRSPDYCRADTRERTGNHPENPSRAAAQALCEALIGNQTSEFSADPDNYVGGRGDGVTLQINSGNRDLRSEEAKTWTFGAVVESPFDRPAVDDMTFTVDWYRIEIDDAIATVSAQLAYDLCFNRDGRSNPTYSINDPNGVCANIERDEVTGAAMFVNSQFQNLGILKTSGVDADFSWRASLADLGMERAPGSLALNISFSKLFEFKAQEYATATPLENAGTLARGGLFDWRLLTTLRYTSNGRWSAALTWRHLPSVKSAQYVTDPETSIQGAGSYDVVRLTGNWNLSDTLSLSAGIDNLFDREPERVGAGQIQNIAAVNGGGRTVLNGSGSTSPGHYDVLGRRYFVSLRARF
ncbi:MAG TPA: TonB-dependent receptor [Gammaproteobacteria bacterium]